QVSKAKAAELEKLAAAYKAKDVLFFMLNSNLADSRDQAAAWATKQGVTTPILMDEQQLVGEALGVQREGEVFVIDPKTWNVAYRGPLSGETQPAIDAVLTAKATSTTRVAVTAGQAITFPERAKQASFANISYARDVAPILQEKCVSCHI